MSALRVLAPGKVNLCLFLGPLRDDGRHELITLFESLSLADRLEVAVAAGGADEVICPGLEGPNLAALALAGLRRRGWQGPPLRVRIDKRVPIAAGMGGGSADAAAVLRAARALAPVDEATLSALARELGADVPAQLEPGLWLGSGAGERLREAPRLPDHWLVLVPSRQRLATPAVFAEADRLGLGRTAGELAALAARLERRPTGGWPEPVLLINDLEPAAVSLLPEVGSALEAVRETGADHALVCGSGPTVAGVHSSEPAAAAAAEALRPEHPGTVVARPVGAAFAAPAFAAPARAPAPAPPPT